MANLIITIIGIALLAIVAIAGIMYVSTTMDNGQAKTWANATISQNQQIFAAFNDWSVNHGGTSFSNVGFDDLLNQNYLSSWPNLAMTSPNPSNGTGTETTSPYDIGCPIINGYQGLFSRIGCSAPNGTNVIVLYMKLNDPYIGCATQNAGNGYGFENVNYINHPYVALAHAINQITGTVPASATIAASGIPYAPTGSTTTICTPEAAST